MRKTRPTAREIRIDDSTPRGAWRVASTVSSPNVPAVSKPYTMKIDMIQAERKRRQIVPAGRRLRAAGVQEDRHGLVVGEEQQDQCEHDHAEDLGRHADVVQDRQQPDAVGVDQRRDQQRRQRDERVHVAQADRGRRIEEVLPAAGESGDDVADDDRDRTDRHDLGPEVEPAGEPAEGPVGQALRPLVDGAGDREVAGQLGEDQRDDQLAADDDRATTRRSPRVRPGRCPTPKLPNEPVETLMKLNAIAKLDRKPKRPPQLGFDAQRAKVGVVARRDLIWVRRYPPRSLLLLPPRWGARLTSRSGREDAGIGGRALPRAARPCAEDSTGSRRDAVATPGGCGRDAGSRR